MKVLLLGVTGEIGQCVATRALATLPTGTVTLLVRNELKLKALVPEELLQKALQVVQGDINDTASLAEAMVGQQACICTAGNARTAPEDFKSIFQRVVTAAAANLNHPKRLWMMAGVTVTDVPGRPGLALNDLPIFSSLPFRVHSHNYGYLQAEGSSLDWSLMCPGPLHRRPQQDWISERTATFTEQAAVWVPWWFQAAWVPRVLLAILILPQMRRFAVTLETVADVMVANLAPGGQFSTMRVGITKTL